MKSEAPASIASITNDSCPSAEHMMTTACSSCLMISRVASIPLLKGITMSMVVRSGRSSLCFSTASTPLDASPTTSNPPEAKMSLIMFRMKIASSTTRTRLGMQRSPPKTCLGNVETIPLAACGELAAQPGPEERIHRLVDACRLEHRDRHRVQARDPTDRRGGMSGAWNDSVDRFDSLHLGHQQAEITAPAVEKDDLLSGCGAAKAQQTPQLHHRHHPAAKVDHPLHHRGCAGNPAPLCGRNHHLAHRFER